MPSWVYFMFAVMAWVWIYLIWKRFRIRKLVESRPGENFESFRVSFETEKVPGDILEAVYAKMQFYLVEELPIRANDDLGKVYGLDSDELEDVIGQLLAECHRQLPPNFLELTPVIVHTVRDLALIVEACPKILTRRFA